MSELSEEEIARELFDEMEGPVANQDFGRQQRQWELCQRLAKTALAILQPALERARREERERCAVIADKLTEQEREENGYPYHVLGEQIAAAIRKG